MVSAVAAFVVSCVCVFCLVVSFVFFWDFAE